MRVVATFDVSVVGLLTGILFLIDSFFTGCSMFLPVYDAATDTYDALHKRSPFSVNAICMVAAKVRDGGGPPSEAYKKCLKEVHDITCATLFAPVTRQEVVQAMILVAGWGAGPKDSGWLTCGHATRMALELGRCIGLACLCNETHSLFALSQECTKLGRSCLSACMRAKPVPLKMNRSSLSRLARGSAYTYSSISTSD